MSRSGRSVASRAAAVLAALALLLGSSTLRAHSVGVWAEPDGDEIVVEAYFSNGKPVRQALVKVRSEDADLVAEGELTSEGRWRFPRPVPGRYEISVEAGEAHGGEFVLELPANAD